MKRHKLLNNRNERLFNRLLENQGLEHKSSIKEEEIKRLEAAALKRPSNYAFWWASGGFVAGTVTTLLVFFAVK